MRNHSTLFLFVFAVCQVFSMSKAGLRVLVVAPHNSSTKSHFNLSKSYAVILGRQEFVDSVHFLIPVWEHEEADGYWPSKEKIRSIQSDKVQVHLHAINYADVQKLGNYVMDTRAGAQKDEKQKNKKGANGAGKSSSDRRFSSVGSTARSIWMRGAIGWMASSRPKEAQKPKKWPVVNPQMSRYIIYENGQLIFEVMAKDKKLMNKLKAKNFHLGMAEQFHLGAFALFPLLGIRHTVITCISTMNSVWYDFAGIREVAIRHRIPERKAVIADRDAAIQEQRDYAKDYEDALTVYNADLAKAEVEFRKIYAGYKQEFNGFRSLFAQTDYKFVNWQLGMDFPQLEKLKEYMRGWVFVGGINMPKQLGTPNQQTQEWVKDERYKHIVPVSFGSILETEEMPVEYFRKFMATFGKFPRILFVWNFKFGPEKLDKKRTVPVPGNVRLVKWMQLPLILANPKTPLIVSHCGGGSATESMAVGVPIICIPFSAGQPYTARALRAQGLGQLVEIDEMVVSDRLEEAIAQGLQWKSGNEKFKKQSAIVRGQMQNAEQNFIDAMEQFAVSHHHH